MYLTNSALKIKKTNNRTPVLVHAVSSGKTIDIYYTENYLKIVNQENGIKIVNHPPYSSDLAPCD